MHRLEDNIPRCHDATCPRRERCLRWLERDVGNRWVPMHSSLRQPGAASCLYQIRPQRPWQHEEETE